MELFKPSPARACTQHAQEQMYKRFLSRLTSILSATPLRINRILRRQRVLVKIGPNSADWSLASFNNPEYFV